MTPSDSTPEKQPVRPRETSRRVGRRAGVWLFRLLIIAPVIVGLLLVLRFFAFKKLTTETDEALVPTVHVVQPQLGPPQIEITLPGDLTAYSSASLYARTNGYLKDWTTDLGARVTQGEVMAEISAPDVDAQLNQAKANLLQMQANLEFARLNFQRQQELLKKDVSSQQDFDQARANYDADVAAVKAAQATVDNLTVQQNFQKIIAPFPGVVTQRNIDVGDLVNATADTSPDESKALFQLARTDILRVFVNVPQTYSPLVKVGTKAYLTLAEYPGQKFEGAITNIAGALDPSTRTLNTEVQVPNADGKLFPGAFAQVHLVFPATPALSIPSNTLIFRSDGLQVGTVDAQGIVHLKPITISRDLGATVEIATGLTTSDQVITNPSDSLSDGLHVDIAK